MAAGVRSVAIRFLGDTKDLEKAGGQGEKAMGKWQKSFQKLDKVATGVLLGLGGAIAGSVVAMARMGDEIAKTAPKLGVTTDQLQEMRFWAEQNGLSHSDLERAVGRLNQRLGDGEAEGNKYVEAIQDLGVATQDTNGQVRETGDVMVDTIAALSEIESSSERSAAAAEIFGTKMARELMPVLEDGSLSLEDAAARAHELGIVMDGDALDASEDFNDAINELKHVGVGLIRDFATPFLHILTDQVIPVIQDRVIPIIRRMGDFIQNNRGLVVGIAGALLGLAVVIKAIALTIKIVTAVQWLWNLAMMANPIGLIIVGIVALIAVIVLIVMHWETVRDVFLKVWDQILDAFKSAGDWIRRTFWEGGLKKVFAMKMAAVNRVRDVFRNAMERVQSIVGNVLDFFTGLPGKIRSAFSKLRSILMSPFKAAFGAIAGLWNNTVGSISFEAPSWVPGIGGKGFSLPTIPTFHQGGTVPGRIGEEVLILAQGGEEVRTPEQQQSGESPTVVHVSIDGRAIDESLMRVSTVRDRRTRGRALAGSGALR